MKLFCTTPPETPVPTYSNLATSKMFLTSEECAEIFKKSKTARGFAGHIQVLIREAQLEILLDYLTELD